MQLPINNSSRFKFTVRAWPVIALVTIGLCFSTQLIAKTFGIELPDQQNVTIVRNCLLRAFSSAKAFGVAAFLAAQVIVIMPVIEEWIFRWAIFKLSAKSLGFIDRERISAAVAAAISSTLFSAAHYIAQPWPDSAFIALFFFGLAQCWLYRKTRRLWCAMLNHALFNLTNLMLLFVVE